MGFQNGGGTATGKGPKLHRANVGNPPEEQHPTADAGDDDDDDDGTAGVFAALQDLQSSGRIALWRIAPTWAAGFLCTLESTEPLDLEAVRREFGGGTYSARPMQQNKRGSFRFKPGAVRFQIVGAPLIEGRLAQPQQPAPPRVVAPDAILRRDGTAQVNHEGVIERLLDEMAAMRREFAAATQQQAHALPPAAAPVQSSAAPLGGIASLQGLAAQMRELKKVRAALRDVLDEDDDDDDDDDDSDKPAQSLEEKLLERIFTEDKPAAQQAKPATQPTQQRGQPRLIRAGQPVPPTPPRAEEQPRSAAPPPPPPPPPPQPADAQTAADLGGAEGTPDPADDARAPTADAVLQHMAQLDPEQGQQLLKRLIKMVPKNVLLTLAERGDD